MKWFLVRYIYQIISGNDDYHVQFDEQLRLMMALDKGDALDKAESKAGSFHPPFRNCKNELVTWKFICIANLHEIETPDDGAEITSILHEPADVSEFLNHIEKRKSYLQKLITIVH